MQIANRFARFLRFMGLLRKFWLEVIGLWAGQLRM